ncbi:MAG: hypothetical protein II755_13385 [Prevotella sp.]|nr:hypothetical protein [Prevotella sp.]
MKNLLKNEKISIFALNYREPPSHTAGRLCLDAANDEAFFLENISFLIQGERRKSMLLFVVCICNQGSLRLLSVNYTLFIRGVPDLKVVFQASGNDALVFIIQLIRHGILHQDRAQLVNLLQPT